MQQGVVGVPGQGEGNGRGRLMEADHRNSDDDSPRASEQLPSTPQGSSIFGRARSRQPATGFIPLPGLPLQHDGGQRQQRTPRFRPKKPARKRSPAPTPTVGAQSAPIQGVRLGLGVPGVAEGSLKHEERQPRELEGEGSQGHQAQDARADQPLLQETERVFSPLPEAIGIALAQIDTTGVWYTSARELAITSVEVCMACRKVPVMRVKVDGDTPMTLFKKASITSYIPPISSSALKEVRWLMPVSFVSTPIATEVLARVECLIVDDDYNFPVANVLFPPNLKPIAGLSWPTSLMKLAFGFRFNQPVDNISWPHIMVELTFGYRFNHPVENVSWPARLEKLTFGRGFTQTIVPASLPSSLEHLTLLRPGAVLPICPGVNVSGVPA
eukprot:g11813.t1